MNQPVVFPFCFVWESLFLPDNYLTLFSEFSCAKACVAEVLEKFLLLKISRVLLRVMIDLESFHFVPEFWKSSLLGDLMSCLENLLPLLNIPKSIWSSILTFECWLGNPNSAVIILDYPEPLKWLPSKVYDRLSKLWSWYKVLSREKFGTFINSVNILGIKDKAKHKQRNSHGFPFHWNLTCLWDFVANSTGKPTSFKMVAFLSTEKDPPFWDNHMGLIYSTLLVWWPDDFPNPFSPLRTECLLIGPLISFSQKCSPSSTFPEFPDPLTFMTLSGIVSLNYFQDCWVVCQLFPVP